MLSVSENELRAAHLRTLEDEEIGVRHRIFNYYVPLFQQFCQSRGVPTSSIRILDCGCGNGASVEHLASAGFAAWGVDLADFRLEQWAQRAQLPQVHLVGADATALPFRTAMFDIVFSSGMLEHIGVSEACDPAYRVSPLPDRVERRTSFISEALRILRPGGVFYLDHPNGAFPIDFWHNDWRSRPRLHMPFETFLPSYREVRRMLRQVRPHASIEAISPAGRFTFRRANRRWYGKLFTGMMDVFFSLLRNKPFSWLASSPLNPYLVMRITPDPPVHTSTAKRDQR